MTDIPLPPVPSPERMAHWTEMERRRQANPPLTDIPPTPDDVAVFEAADCTCGNGDVPAHLLSCEKWQAVFALNNG